jgi:hypothetical protein
MASKRSVWVVNTTLTTSYNKTSIISNNLSTKPYWKVLREWSSDWNSNPTPTSDRIQTIQTWFEQEKKVSF